MVILGKRGVGVDYGRHFVLSRASKGALISVTNSYFDKFQQEGNERHQDSVEKVCLKNHSFLIVFTSHSPEKIERYIC